MRTAIIVRTGHLAQSQLSCQDVASRVDGITAAAAGSSGHRISPSRTWWGTRFGPHAASIVGNPALVRFVARQFDDIEHLGFVRLLRTIERFDPKRRSLE